MFLLVVILSVVLFFIINKVSFIIIIVHRIDVVVGVSKSDLAHLRFVTRNFIFIKVWAWGINILLELFGYLPMIMVILKYIFLSYFLFMNNVPLKGRVSNFTSWCINNYINPLFLSPHPIKSYFRYIIEDFPFIWTDMDLYCLTAGLWTHWRWFGPFWWWKVLLYFCWQ